MAELAFTVGADLAAQGNLPGARVMGYDSTVDLTVDWESPFIAVPDGFRMRLFYSRGVTPVGGGGSFGTEIRGYFTPASVAHWQRFAMQDRGSSTTIERLAYPSGGSVVEVFNDLTPSTGSDQGSLLAVFPGRRIRLEHTADAATGGSLLCFYIWLQRLI